MHCYSVAVINVYLYSLIPRLLPAFNVIAITCSGRSVERVCDIEKLGGAWGRGYNMCTYKHSI